MSGDQTVAPAPICAVVFCDVSPAAAFHIKRWTDAGHKIAACIISGKSMNARWRRDKWRRCFAPDWSLKYVLRHRRIPLICAPRNLKSAEFAAVIRDLHADVLISVAFPNRITEELTALFKFGGVNVHPALLPHYRGPHPAQMMAIDRTTSEYGGVTLHRVASGFDDGDIIAQAPFNSNDLARPEWHSIAFAQRGAELLVAALPAFVAGKIKAVPQPAGDWRYARLNTKDLVLTSDMSVDDIALRARVLGSLGKLNIELLGINYRIGGFSGAWKQQPIGKVLVTFLTVEFDACDGRVKLFRENRLFRRYRDWLLLRELRRASHIDS